jgi:hypothetical protein
LLIRDPCVLTAARSKCLSSAFVSAGEANSMYEAVALLIALLLALLLALALPLAVVPVGLGRLLLRGLSAPSSSLRFGRCPCRLLERVLPRGGLGVRLL